MSTQSPATVAPLFSPKYPLSLAPMVGLTHTALRSLVADLGGCGIFYTEMLAARRLPSENPHLSAYIKTTEAEKPLVYQLFLSDKKHLQPAIKKVHALGGDGIDINLGCPAPSVKKCGAGAALGSDKKKVQEIIREARRLTDLHLSVKIRLGHPGEEEQLLPFCQMFEDEGVNQIAIHARYHGEKFCRHPKWEFLAPVCKNISIPVYANGGIASVDDARSCLERSGADGLMIGRAGVQKPWLFADIARQIYGANIDEPERNPQILYYLFLDKLFSSFAPEKQLGRLKQFTHYMAINHKFGHHLASKVQSSNTIREALCFAEDFYGVSYTQEGNDD